MKFIISCLYSLKQHFLIIQFMNRNFCLKFNCEFWRPEKLKKLDRKRRHCRLGRQKLFENFYPIKMLTHSVEIKFFAISKFGSVGLVKMLNPLKFILDFTFFCIMCKVALLYSSFLVKFWNDEDDNK